MKFCILVGYPPSLFIAPFADRESAYAYAKGRWPEKEYAVVVLTPPEETRLTLTLAA